MRSEHRDETSTQYLPRRHRRPEIGFEAIGFEAVGFEAVGEGWWSSLLLNDGSVTNGDPSRCPRCNLWIVSDRHNGDPVVMELIEERED
jgi:hypothetical protein